MTATNPGEHSAVAGAAPEQANTPVRYDAKQLYGIDRSVPITGYSRPWDTPMLKSPQVDEKFHWRKDFATEMIMWWYSGDLAARLIGPTGSGKTKGALQFFAKLNMPVVSISCNPRTEASQLIGGMALTPTGYKFVYGAVARAALEGVPVLIDEYNLLDPGEAVGLNALLEGYPFTIPETGETITPRQGFRIIATMNPKGNGYRGRNASDLSNDDRFVDIVVGYMPEAEERALIAADFAELTKQAADSDAAKKISEFAVGFANMVREQYMGNNVSAAALPCTMSTRVLRRWVKWWVAAGKFGATATNDNHAHYALRHVLTNRQPPEVAQALHALLVAKGEPEKV